MPANPPLIEDEIETLGNRLLRYGKNTSRLLTLPLTQLIMAAGVFPGQMISAIMNPLRKIPGIRDLVAKLAIKTGKGRTAYQVWAQDYYQSNEAFSFPLPPTPADTTGLVFNENSYYQVPYKSKFGFKRSLETFSFEHENFKNITPDEQYYRLHCSGNSGPCSRFFSELAELSQTRPELKTLTYNHPGIEGSTGFTLSQDDLVDALCTQVMDLLKKGAKAENIELSGFSIGAATAALAAAKLQAKGIHVNLFCARTFGTMSAVVADNIPLVSTVLKFLKAIPVVKWFAQATQKLIEWIAIKPLLWLSNWNMQPAQAYKKIDAHRKALTVVKPETKGAGIWKRLAKNIGELTGYLKHKNPDRRIATHVSLDSEVNKTGSKKKNYQLALQSLYKPDGIENLDTAYLESDNAISRNALERYRRLYRSPSPMPVYSTNLINLAILGWKGRRLQGTYAKNAHDVAAQDIKLREIKNPKWVGRDRNEAREEAGENSRALVTGALAASLGPYDSSERLTEFTYYKLFHDAIKNHNKIVEPERQAGLELRV